MNYKILSYITRFINNFDEHLKSNATEQLEYELEEMEYVFALLVYKSFIGFPGLPEGIAIELLPYMTDEIKKLEEKSSETGDQLSQLFSKFNFE